MPDDVTLTLPAHDAESRLAWHRTALAALRDENARLAADAGRQVAELRRSEDRYEASRLEVAKLRARIEELERRVRAADARTILARSQPEGLEARR